ncbi:MAG: hypothetical protein HY660_04105 [Armatimonadetes bacterium]|nr:hypothetical protein [Armatimonadota bacterium]
MARPRYKAEKRARELRKQAERARKLARKHGKKLKPGEETPVDSMGSPEPGASPEPGTSPAPGGWSPPEPPSTAS